MGIDATLRSLMSATLLPPNEARILMAQVLDQHYQLPRSALLSRDDMELHAQALEEWKTLESRRLQGEPIAYLIGKRGFHNIELQVAPGVLIPRPETELLVEIGLREIKQIEKEVITPKVLDLGTGSGAIALAMCSGSGSLSSAPRQLLSSSTSPIACTRELSFCTRLPSPKPVEPSSPVRVAITESRMLIASLLDYRTNRARSWLAATSSNCWLTYAASMLIVLPACALAS